MIEAIIESIDTQLQKYNFTKKKAEALPARLRCRAIWTRRTWNTNRIVALVEIPNGTDDIQTFFGKIRWKLLRHVFFIPFLYEPGLQLIGYGNNVFEKEVTLDAIPDKINNQLCVLQSVFMIDVAEKKYKTARAWGQIITGKYQDAILKGIQDSGFDPENGSHGRSQ